MINMRFFAKYKWGNWQDLAVGSLGSSAYVLQGKRRADGKVKFRVSESGKYYGR
jgi:hypothetical protein